MISIHFLSVILGVVSGFTPRPSTSSRSVENTYRTSGQLRRPVDFPLFMIGDETRTDETFVDDDLGAVDSERRQTLINAVAGGLLLSTAVASGQFYLAQAYAPDGFRRISPTRFIAALGDPKANAGTNAQDWGLWVQDPGPRGVWLRDYQKVLLNSNQHRAPAGWTFDKNDWWLEEHGLIMEAPTFPVPTGRYLVTGGRAVTTGLTIDSSGNWKLDGGATLYDVTHLPCRSARYRPKDEFGGPSTANPSDFPVLPGAPMPSVAGCDKQDYAVLFLVGKPV